jgi:hypothetical protein
MASVPTTLLLQKKIARKKYCYPSRVCKPFPVLATEFEKSPNSPSSPDSPSSPKPIQNDVGASIQEDVAASIQEDVAASIQEDVAASIQNDVAASIQDDIAASIQVMLRKLIFNGAEEMHSRH